MGVGLGLEGEGFGAIHTAVAGPAPPVFHVADLSAGKEVYLLRGERRAVAVAGGGGPGVWRGITLLITSSTGTLPTILRMEGMMWRVCEVVRLDGGLGWAAGTVGRVDGEANHL